MPETTRPYAAQFWAPGLLQNVKPTSFLQLLARDLEADAEENGITGGDLELWEKPDGTKGLAFGDTSGLPADGWTKLATL